MRKIKLDWARLLGFDHVDPARQEPAPTGNAGCEEAVTPLQAKVGSKQQDGVIGRPQELFVIKSRVAA